ncbi:hypothetical protein GCM10027282_15580 [Frigoribacterium salinisoli]
MFLIFDVALVAHVLLRPDEGAASAEAVSPPEALPEESEASTTPEPTEPPRPLAPPESFLSAVNSQTAYRAATGDCGAGSSTVLEKTDDGGATWSASAVSTDMHSVTRLQAVTADYAYLVGLSGPSCTLDLTATYTSGQGFGAYPERLPATWRLSSVENGELSSPSRVDVAPCESIVSLAPRTDLAAGVLCSDGALMTTADGGVTWSPGVQVPYAVSVSSTDQTYVLAIAGSPACDGVGVLRTVGDASATTAALSGCAADLDPTASSIVVAAAQESVWLSDGTTTRVSVDSGASF